MMSTTNRAKPAGKRKRRALNSPTSQSDIPPHELLAANLIFERARARFSQAALAEASGLTRQTISEIERGVANPTLDVMWRITTALGIPIARLFIEVNYGPVDDDELERRRATAREDSVNARDYLAALEEVDGRAAPRYSGAGRPRMGS